MNTPFTHISSVALPESIQQWLKTYQLIEVQAAHAALIRYLSQQDSDESFDHCCTTGELTAAIDTLAITIAKQGGIAAVPPVFTPPMGVPTSWLESENGSVNNIPHDTLSDAFNDTTEIKENDDEQ